MEDHLFQLVKSLEINEKRYFKLFAKLQKGEAKKYLTIFEYYDNADQYNEETFWNNLCIPFDNDKNKFAVTKNYLYKLILKSLRFSQENNYIEHKLYSQLLEANILEEKGLYKHSAKLLRSLKKQAEKYEVHPILIELLRKQILSFFGSETKKLEEVIEQCYTDMEYVLNNYNNELKYEKLAHQVFTLSREKGGIQKDDTQLYDKLAKVKTNSFFKTDKKATTFKAKYLFYYSKSIYHYLLRKNSGKAYEIGKEVIKIWESRPDMIKAYPKRYKIYLTTYLNTCFSEKAFDEIPKYIKIFKSLPAKSFDEEAEDFQNIYFLELLYLLNKIKLQEALQVIPQIEDGLLKYKGKINKSRELTFYHNITIIYFLLEDFTNALKWQNKILFDPKSGIRKDLQQFASILQLVYHYELNNHKVLEYLYDNTYRNLRRKGQLYQFEKIVLQNILKLMNALNEEGKKTSFLHFHEELLGLKKEASVRLIGMDEILIWLEARINGQSFLDFLKGKS